MKRLLPVVLVAAAACSAAGTVSDPERVCASFADLSYSGLYDATEQTGDPVIWEFIGVIVDGDPEDATVEPFPMRDAPLEVWAAGGTNFPDARLGLALCKGDGCAGQPDPAFWKRRLKHTTDGNGVLQFSTFVGYGVAGSVVVEFDNVSCLIGVNSAETQ